MQILINHLWIYRDRKNRSDINTLNSMWVSACIHKETYLFFSKLIMNQSILNPSYKIQVSLVNQASNVIVILTLFVFYIPSTARSFRDGTPIYWPLWRKWSSVNTPFPPGIEPEPSRGSPLRYRCATQAAHRGCVSRLNVIAFTSYYKILVMSPY